MVEPDDSVYTGAYERGQANILNEEPMPCELLTKESPSLVATLLSILFFSQFNSSQKNTSLEIAPLIAKHQISCRFVKAQPQSSAEATSDSRDGETLDD